jgi:hypothetical protein
LYVSAPGNPVVVGEFSTSTRGKNKWNIYFFQSQELPPLKSEADVTQFSNEIIRILKIRIETANFSPSALPAAQRVVETAEMNLKDCENDLNTNHLIYQYKICASNELKNGLDEISNLRGSYAYAASSANRLKFIFWNVIIGNEFVFFVFNLLKCDIVVNKIIYKMLKNWLKKTSF